MPDTRHYLLIGEAGNFHIQVGDIIEITEAYQRQNIDVALANTFRINETYRNYCISAPYTKKLNRLEPVKGEIVQLSREEQDMTITVSAA